MSNLSQLVPPLLQGLEVTLELTILSAVLGCFVSFAAGLARLSGRRSTRYPAAVFVEVFRGTSSLVLLFWAYFALPLLGLRLSPLIAGVLALGLSYGAYGAEVVRGAVLSVPAAQTEAAVALNLTPFQCRRLVVLPQAIRAMLPPLGNLLVDLLKATSLASLITLSDMTFRGKLEQQSVGHTTEVFVLVLVIYFVVAYVLTLGMRALERRASRHVQVMATGAG